MLETFKPTEKIPEHLEEVYVKLKRGGDPLVMKFFRPSQVHTNGIHFRRNETRFYMNEVEWWAYIPEEDKKLMEEEANTSEPMEI